MARVRDRRAHALSMGAVSLLAAIAAAALVTGFSYLSSPAPTALLSSEAQMEGYLHKASQGMHTLESALPGGAAARKFPAAETQLRGALEHGEAALGAVGREVRQEELSRRAAAARHAAHKVSSGPAARVSSLAEVKAGARSMHDLVAKEERNMRTLIAQLPAQDRAVFPREAREVTSVLERSMHQLGDIERQTERAAARRGVRLASLARVAKSGHKAFSAKQLDSDKLADDAENRALSTDDDAADVLGTINALPAVRLGEEDGAKAKHAVRKARVQSLAAVGGGEGAVDIGDEVPARRWGTVYNPTAKSDSLHGAARKQYLRWTNEVNKVMNVYDPMEHKTPNPFNQLKSTDWWKSKHYKISASSGRHPTDDAWWLHDHKGRGW